MKEALSLVVDPLQTHQLSIFHGSETMNLSSVKQKIPPGKRALLHYLGQIQMYMEGTPA